MNPFRNKAGVEPEPAEKPKKKPFDLERYLMMEHFGAFLIGTLLSVLLIAVTFVRWLDRDRVQDAQRAYEQSVRDLPRVEGVARSWARAMNLPEPGAVSCRSTVNGDIPCSISIGTPAAVYGVVCERFGNRCSLMTVGGAR